jgi:hypothetical protein
VVGGGGPPGFPPGVGTRPGGEGVWGSEGGETGGGSSTNTGGFSGLDGGEVDGLPPVINPGGRSGPPRLPIPEDESSGVESATR